MEKELKIEKTNTLITEEIPSHIKNLGFLFKIMSLNNVTILLFKKNAMVNSPNQKLSPEKTT